MNKEMMENEKDLITISTSRGSVNLTEDEVFWLLQDARCGARTSGEEALDRREKTVYLSDEWADETSNNTECNKRWFLYKAIGEWLQMF